mmetsp:Transcript_25221/g.54877  ORF Transcript_25221/g.54877 Transcript_25221/m.54877 type:complete len:315 (-) Transcript_25221:2355-3299(-)
MLCWMPNGTWICTRDLVRPHGSSCFFGQIVCCLHEVLDGLLRHISLALALAECQQGPDTIGEVIDEDVVLLANNVLHRGESSLGDFLITVLSSSTEYVENDFPSRFDPRGFFLHHPCNDADDVILDFPSNVRGGNHEYFEGLKKVCLELEHAQFFLVQEFPGQLSDAIDCVKTHLDVGVACCLDEVFAHRSPHLLPFEAGAPHVVVCDLHQLLQRENPRLICESQLLLGDTSQLCHEMNDSLWTQRCSLVEEQLDLCTVDLRDDRLGVDQFHLSIILSKIHQCRHTKTMGSTLHHLTTFGADAVASGGLMLPCW